MCPSPRACPELSAVFVGIPTGATELSFGYNDDMSRATTRAGGDIGVAYSAVPEPSIWAMMLLGFAGLGFAGYLDFVSDAALTA